MYSSLSSGVKFLILTAHVVTATFSFTYNNESFLLNGEPYQIIGGQMDPQRIPAQLWQDRLYKARAMGLNTIFSYVFWDQVQPTPQTWDFSGRNNIAEYFRIAQDLDLKIVLRAVPGMVVRSNNEPFLNASRAYLDRLAIELELLLVTNGGPILMAQIENEYGSYGSDAAYKSALAGMLKETFGITLYTNDGGVEDDIVAGQIPGILAETDGDPRNGFEARDEYADPSNLGPQLDGEYYITWLGLWASNSTYLTDVGDPSAIATVQADLKWTLANNHSFSIYMFHGGTNFGFQNGADWSSSLTPVITSYDYGAPLDESGRKTDIYDALRETIGNHVGIESLPPVPENYPPISIPPIELSPRVALFDSLPQPIVARSPVNMEALGQSHGFVLYRHTAKTYTNGTLSPGDTPRDRVLVYVNENRVGVIDSIYQTPQTVNLSLKPNDVLDLLVENMGRVNYGPRIPDQRKGIIGNVTIGSHVLSDWEIFSLPMASPLSPTEDPSFKASNSSAVGPIFYSGTFDVTEVGDTFLELSGGTKGVVWVNGENLGRYWIVGPQQTLYLPGCYLKTVGNEISVFNLEPSRDQGAVNGVITRKWGNNPDPDAL